MMMVAPDTAQIESMLGDAARRLRLQSTQSTASHAKSVVKQRCTTIRTITWAHVRPPRMPGVQKVDAISAFTKVQSDATFRGQESSKRWPAPISQSTRGLPNQDGSLRMYLQSIVDTSTAHLCTSHGSAFAHRRIKSNVTLQW